MQYCPDEMVIDSAAECKVAARVMGKQWGGTVFKRGGHKDCMYGLQDWKVYFNLANASDTPTRAPYGSVCRAEKWQNYTKAYHLVGAGFCRPEGCDPDESSCRVNGYYGSTVTKLDCRRACELEANCIGFSFMPSRTECAAVSGCFVHTNTSTASSMPKKWVPYEKDFYSIGGASGDALAMCYRIETKNPAEPRKSGCYFKQPTSGNGRCGGPFLTWTADNHGRKNLWSWENEALCLQRKTEHDDYCGTNTTWMFVPNRADQALPSTAASAGWQIFTEFRIALKPSALFNQFEETLSFEAKNAFCLMSPTALGVGMLYIGKWETMDIGAQWSNLWVVVPITNSGAAPKDDHSLGSVMGMMILDSILYQVLAWYVEKVRPGTLGLPQPWYFPLLPSYWWPEKVHGGRPRGNAQGV
ncbi:unnamed protein product [Durusdinium trenchii]|uniref:Apple domain-containing protein n=1 Tax=Durusdinium trenchii TaxID=1381693 RepID=A0ABP0SB34_9DINO